MKKYGLLIMSIIVFFVLFYILNNNEQTKIYKIETFSPMSNETTPINLDVNPQANAVDARYLNDKTAQLVNLKKELSEMRNTLYQKKLTDFLIIQPKYKSLEDSANPQQYDIEISKTDNFSNTIDLSVPIGIKGEQGAVGNKGPRGPQGPQGEKGPVGHCGAIIS